MNIILDQRGQTGGSRPGAAGFSLIEVLLALAVFSIGLMAVAGMQIASVNKNSAASMNTLAVEYASQWVEQLMNLGTTADITENGTDDDSDGTVDEADEVLAYPQLAAGTHTPDNFDGMDWDDNGVVDLPPSEEFGDIFDLSWSVTNSTPGTSTTVKEITVTVRWAQGNKQISLNALRGPAL